MAHDFLDGRTLVVAFEGWNDAGEAASGAVRTLKTTLTVHPILQIDPELYFDFQFNRPNAVIGEDGKRSLEWPDAVMYGPARASTDTDRQVDETPTPSSDVRTALSDASEPADTPTGLTAITTDVDDVYLLLGTEPSRSWKAFTAEIIDAALAADVGCIVFLGAMLADVPHTRPISTFASSENADVRAALGIEKSTYEGPVGILSVIGDAAEAVGIPTISIWASVPHYVHNAPSPKATLALIEKLEEFIDVKIPRGSLEEESAAWESGIDALAADDDEMGQYIEQLEQARDTVDSPEASGEAIAQEFERYLRKRGDGRDGQAGGKPDDQTPPWRG